MEKLNSLFKEELWGRIEPKDIGISRFKILDDLFNNLVSEGLLDEASELCRDHMKEHVDSITASYLIGIIGYHSGKIEDTVQFRKLIDVFLGNHKWAVVQRIAEKILEYGENRIALKALATSLEKLGRSKEAIPFWESLLKIDRFDADVAKKLAFAIIEDDPEKSIQYMKLSIEGFLKNGAYNHIAELWNKLVTVSWEDIQFFERIERMLVEAKQQDMAAGLLKTLFHKYRDEENPDQSIEILKKILEYSPEDNSARKDLIKLYDKKYGEHSQYQQFLKLSRLNNFKAPVKHAIHDFEKNIVFDKGNYSFHRSWGMGKIMDINGENIVIDFRGKPDHKMSIQMALQSLTPLGKEHIYVLEYEDPDTLKDMFKQDFRQFFEILIKSYDGRIMLADIKKELIPKYVDAKNWSKWWNTARTEIKKDPNFGVSEKKKDLFIMRDKPVTFAEELLDNFTKAKSFSEKLDTAIEFANNIEADEGVSVSPYFIDYYTKEIKEGSPTKQILSYFILKSFTRYTDAKKLKLDTLRAGVINYIRASGELPLISIKIGSYDFKKDLINLIEETREDWSQIIAEILFETPIRIHKYILNDLIRAHAFNVINSFIDRVITGAKQYPEIFLWVSRSLLSRTWDYDWLDYTREGLLLTHFRLLNELKKIETKGNRLKNLALEILFDNDGAVLKDIIDQSPKALLSRVYDIFSGVSYVEESHVEKFRTMITNKYPDFTLGTQPKATLEWEIDVEKLIVSQVGYDRMRGELNRMVNVEMGNISRELAKVSDVTGDVRENVEYNTLMEKQTILKMAINKLEDEIKKAEILDANNVSADAVNIGTRVLFQEIETGEKSYYTIMGPWDADFEKKILSYRSPIARALLGKKAGDEVDLRVGEDKRKHKILSIEKYTS